MKQIIVGFSRPKKWKPFAKLIMFTFKISYDHVYIKFHSNTYERDIIYQASKRMVNFIGTTLFESENIVIQEFPVQISDINYISLMQFVIDNAGKPYSLKEILGLALVKMCSFFGKTIENPCKEGTDEYVCSVLAGYILKNYTKEDIDTDFQDITPKYLYDFFINKVSN